jgi:hypothetical protein
MLGKTCCRKLGYCKGTTVMANKVRIPVSALSRLSAEDTGLGYGDDTIKEDKTKKKNVESSKDVAKGKKSTAKKSLSDIDEATFKQKLSQGG